jgi:hypothetical protein
VPVRSPTVSLPPGRAFLAMAQLSEGVEDTRRRTRLSEIVAAGETPDDVVAILRNFARPGERLVTFASDHGETMLEVTHEQLIARWPTMRDWWRDWREDERLRRRLAAAAQDLAGRPRKLVGRDRARIAAALARETGTGSRRKDFGNFRSQRARDVKTSREHEPAGGLRGHYSKRLRDDRGACPKRVIGEWACVPRRNVASGSADDWVTAERRRNI